MPYFLQYLLQIDPEEVEDDTEIMLIWDFNVSKANLSLTSTQCSVTASVPLVSSTSTSESMPYLDLSKVHCNCCKPSKQGKLKVLLSIEGAALGLQNLSLTDLASHSEQEEEEDDDDLAEENNDQEGDDEFFNDLTDSVIALGDTKLIAPQDSVNETETCYTETFTLKGSSYHENFQKTLKECKESLINKKTMPVKLSYEPVNIRDEMP